ncbi:TPA: hypothetical protein ACKP7K_005118, partial [Serratia marcescens]
MPSQPVKAILVDMKDKRRVQEKRLHWISLNIHRYRRTTPILIFRRQDASDICIFEMMMIFPW